MVQVALKVIENKKQGSGEFVIQAPPFPIVYASAEKNVITEREA